MKGKVSNINYSFWQLDSERGNGGHKKAGESTSAEEEQSRYDSGLKVPLESSSSWDFGRT